MRSISASITVPQLMKFFEIITLFPLPKSTPLPLLAVLQHSHLEFFINNLSESLEQGVSRDEKWCLSRKIPVQSSGELHGEGFQLPIFYYMPFEMFYHRFILAFFNSRRVSCFLSDDGCNDLILQNPCSRESIRLYADEVEGKVDVKNLYPNTCQLISCYNSERLSLLRSALSDIHGIKFPINKTYSLPTLLVLYTHLYHTYFFIVVLLNKDLFIGVSFSASIPPFTGDNRLTQGSWLVGECSTWVLDFIFSTYKNRSGFSVHLSPSGEPAMVSVGDYTLRFYDRPPTVETDELLIACRDAVSNIKTPNFVDVDAIDFATDFKAGLAALNESALYLTGTSNVILLPNNVVFYGGRHVRDIICRK